MLLLARNQFQIVLHHQTTAPRMWRWEPGPRLFASQRYDIKSELVRFHYLCSRTVHQLTKTYWLVDCKGAEGRRKGLFSHLVLPSGYRYGALLHFPWRESWIDSQEHVVSACVWTCVYTVGVRYVYRDRYVLTFPTKGWQLLVRRCEC